MVLFLSAVPASADGLVVDTRILKEADDAMINNYSLLAVNPEAPFTDADGNAVKDVALNTVGAAALINWLLSEEGQKLAANCAFEEYGEYLFFLNDGRPVSTAAIPAAAEESKLIRLSTASRGSFTPGRAQKSSPAVRPRAWRCAAS